MFYGLQPSCIQQYRSIFIARHVAWFLFSALNFPACCFSWIFPRMARPGWMEIWFHWFRSTISENCNRDRRFSLMSPPYFLPTIFAFFPARFPIPHSFLPLLICSLLFFFFFSFREYLIVQRSAINRMLFLPNTSILFHGVLSFTRD